MAEQTPVAGSGASQEPREVAQPVDQGSPSTEAGRSVSERESGSRSDDLSNHPQFRQMQSEYQKRLADAQKAAEEARREAMESRKLAEAAYTRDMTDSERAAYDEERRYRFLEAERQALAEERNQLARMRDIMNLHRKTGAPVEVLEQASTYDEAVEISLEWATKSARQKAEAEYQAKAEKSAANRVDIGGGTARTEADELEREYQEAKAAGDVVRMMEITFQRRG